MNSRRDFVKTSLLATTVFSAFGQDTAHATKSTDDREFWLGMLQRVAEPVLTNLASGTLRRNMPVECPTGNVESRRKVTHLEALGRALCGVAPWLELQESSASENARRQKLADLARKGIANAVDPASPDYMNFTIGAQNLVDAAFLAHAFIRAPRELWEKLDPTTKARVITEMKATRKWKPGQSNWLLFSAMVETFLARAGEQWEEAPIEKAVCSHESWYKGDGAYGDGADFHWDFYNSFVIQPMLIDVLEQMGKVTPKWNDSLPVALKRAVRYAAVQERLIAPDGSYPPLGRSIAYRCGAFQLLAQMALRQELPKEVSPAQVRCALAAVIRRTLGAPGTFDSNGWLQVGLAGHQPSLAESYISTGSLYLCSAVFLPLGLPATNPCWSEPSADWTSRKIWAGQNLPADHAIKG